MEATNCKPANTEHRGCPIPERPRSFADFTTSRDCFITCAIKPEKPTAEKHESLIIFGDEPQTEPLNYDILAKDWVPSLHLPFVETRCHPRALLVQQKATNAPSAIACSRFSSNWSYMILLSWCCPSQFQLQPLAQPQNPMALEKYIIHFKTLKWGPVSIYIHDLLSTSWHFQKPGPQGTTTLWGLFLARLPTDGAWVPPPGREQDLQRLEWQRRGLQTALRLQTALPRWTASTLPKWSVQSMRPENPPRTRSY